MADLSRLSNVTIALDTASIKIKSFSDMIIIGETDAFTDRIITVTSVSELLAKGVTATDPLYFAVRDALAQKNSGVGVSKVFVGRKAKGVTTTSADVKDKDGNVTTKGSTTTVGAETWLEAVHACRKASKDFYGVCITSTNADDLIAVAGYCESEGLLFGANTSDSNILDASITSDTLSRLAGKFKTFCAYDQYAAEQHLAAAIMGRLFGKQPGTENWSNQRLASVKASALDDTQFSAIKAKHGVTYEDFGDFSLTQNGKVVGNEWIDIIRGRDAMLEEIRSETVLALVDKRVKYNDAGIATIGAAILTILSKYQRIGFIDDAMMNSDGDMVPGFKISLPSAADISRNERANRTLKEVGFNARLAGSINDLDISGTLSYDTNL